MFNSRWPAALLATVFTVGCAMTASEAPLSPRDAVWAAEVAFARTMSDRDLIRFSDFVAGDAIFFSGKGVLNGKPKVIEGWAAFFKESTPPFSWAPDQVEVLGSGTLALSTGPVKDATGQVIARFNSVWRLEPDGAWRVVFDKGSPPSPGPK